MHADSVRLEQLPTGTEPASPISGTSRNQPNAFSAQSGIIGQISTCFRRKRKVNFSEQCTATKILKRGTKKERFSFFKLGWGTVIIYGEGGEGGEGGLEDFGWVTMNFTWFPIITLVISLWFQPLSLAVNYQSIFNSPPCILCWWTTGALPPYISPEKPFDHAIYDWSKSGTQILPCNWSIWNIDQIGP